MSKPRLAKPTAAGPAHPDRKCRYHHGSLRESALRRARVLVRTGGPLALTLRGLARDLGVTAPALVYHFGSVAELRAAVAASVIGEASSASGITIASRRGAANAAASWIDFAMKNPDLYRLACGEGWRRRGVGSAGINIAQGQPVPSPRRTLHTHFVRMTRKLGRPEGDTGFALPLAVAVHGLALAQIEGVPPELVAADLRRLIPA